MSQIFFYYFYLNTNIMYFVVVCDLLEYFI